MELSKAVSFRKWEFPMISWPWIFSLLVVGLSALILAYPLGIVFVRSFAINPPGELTALGLAGWIAAYNDRAVPIAVGNTLLLAVLRIIITTALAIFFAWVVTRTDTPLKGVIEMSLWLGFFLPLLPMTMGWILLLDPQYGLINQFLM